MKTYLSVDIDFWNDLEPEVLEHDLNRLVRLAWMKNIPIVAVMNHQQLLRHVDASGARELVNLDTHSDIISIRECVEFNCGTWIAFVRWRHHGTYRWLHRKSVNDGECSWEHPVFMSRGCWYVRTRPHVTDWKRITRKKVKGLPNISDLLKNCVSVGLVLSPFYSDEGFEEVFRKIVKRYNIPYTKGVRNEEDFRAIRKPTFRRMK